MVNAHMIKIKSILEVLGINPSVSHIQSKRSNIGTTLPYTLQILH